MAAASLNLAETYSLVGSHPDKSDNLHLNGDYHKMLACSHSAYLLLGNWENNRPCCSTPSVWDNKKASIPFREKMLAFTCLPNSYENNAKIAILFRLSSNIVDFFHHDSSFQPFHELQFSLEVLDKSSIISHDSAQGDNLIRGCPFFIPITHWKSIQSPKKRKSQNIESIRN